MSTHASDEARVIPLRPAAAPQAPAQAPASSPAAVPAPGPAAVPPPGGKEPLWRELVGEVLRRERQAQERTLKDVADAARISVPYLSELERGLKEGSSEVLAAAARGLGLGLADLLSRAQHELAWRTTSRVTPSGVGAGTIGTSRLGTGRAGTGRVGTSGVSRGRTTSTRRYDGLCLAA